mmetsp:Transcript_2021/g.1468  ORF Transcript_2021/g.1468 Transcript_2021/m.1468 type:complete len:109 (-) Transcript_2021:249-575(-)
MLAITITIQQLRHKVQQKAVRLMFEDPNSYQTWLDALRKTQRPQWVDPEVNACFICEAQFGILERQHHCRKCGTAVCSKCSNFFVKLEDLSYYTRVRVCRNCLEAVQY